jgi:hypothetical protein
LSEQPKDRCEVRVNKVIPDPETGMDVSLVVIGRGDTAEEAREAAEEMLANVMDNPAWGGSR